MKTNDNSCDGYITLKTTQNNIMTPTLNIDKSNWKKYRFDEFAQNVSERVEPAQTDLDLYVGLEHIDPDCLHLSRHGHPSDVEGTKLRFYAGDVIFGRRRAYQRKTALATQDGICSAHAMVLRAKENIVDSRFFPFLFHSKQFIDMAITISVGGLSPTINWKDIAKQEFLLPPLAEQQRLAELLWAADEMIEKEKRVKENLLHNSELLCSTRIGVCNNGTYQDLNTMRVKISSVLSSERCSVGKLETKDYQSTGLYPIVDQSKVDVVAYSDLKELVYNGKLPVLIFGDHTTIIKYVDFPFILGADGTKIITVKNDLVLPKYLYYAIRNLHIVPQGYRRHFSILKDLEVLIPSLEEQRDIIKELEVYEDLVIKQQEVIAKSQEVKQEIINKIF